MDIADVFAFLDPADNTRLVVAATLVGFIVPSENVNQGAFSAEARYRFELETTGDATPDAFIDVTFDQRTSTTTPQTATISLLGKRTFTAPTTVASLAAAPPTFTVTEDPTTGVRFFAGLVDDPFFFDIPGFNRFVASILQGAPVSDEAAARARQLRRVQRPGHRHQPAVVVPRRAAQQDRCRLPRPAPA